MGLLRLDITNYDFIKNSPHEVYLNIPAKHLHKNKLKIRLHLLKRGLMLDIITCSRILQHEGATSLKVQFRHGNVL